MLNKILEKYNIILMKKYFNIKIIWSKKKRISYCGNNFFLNNEEDFKILILFF